MKAAGFGALLLSAPLAHADSGNTSSPNSLQVNNVGDLVDKVLCPVAENMARILIVASIIIVLIAAYMYLTSEAEDEKLREARRTITYAAVAVVVALVAAGFPSIVASIFNVSVQNCAVLF